MCHCITLCHRITLSHCIAMCHSNTLRHFITLCLRITLSHCIIMCHSNTLRHCITMCHCITLCRRITLRHCITVCVNSVASGQRWYTYTFHNNLCPENQGRGNFPSAKELTEFLFLQYKHKTPCHRSSRQQRVVKPSVELLTKNFFPWESYRRFLQSRPNRTELVLVIYILVSQNSTTIEKTLLRRKQKGNQRPSIVSNNMAKYKVRYNYIVCTFLIITNIESDACFIVSDKRPWSMFCHGLKYIAEVLPTALNEGNF